MTKVSVDTRGSERMAARLSRVSNFLGRDGMRQVCEEAAVELRDGYQKQILEATPGKFTDLTDRYKEVKQKKHGLIYPILYATGGLFNSIRVRLKAPLGGSGWTFALSFVGGTRGGASYDTIGRAHMDGTAHLPKRDFTRLPVGWTARLFDKIRRGLRER